LRLDWDDPIPQSLSSKWELWYNDLQELVDFNVARCLKPLGFGTVVSAQLHNFADASETGYGVVTYLRLQNVDQEIHCAFIMGKARVAPLKQVTIPRLELTAATVAVRTNKMILNELEIPVNRSYFWTDSMSVLRYINNTTSRFQTFVANRLSVIHDGSDSSDWRYVNTKVNPADTASRGISVNGLLKLKYWIEAPEFLYKPEDQWPELPLADLRNIDKNDPEVKRVKVASTISNTCAEHDNSVFKLNKLFERYSSWYKLKRIVAWIIKVKDQLLKRVHKKHGIDHEGKLSEIPHLTVHDLNEAENAIIKVVQLQAFRKEIDALETGNMKIKKDSCIRKLDPCFDNGLLRVGGRLQASSLPVESKHPVILPKNNHVSDLILRNIHLSSNHGGRNHMLSTLRQKYWIVNAPSAIRKLISKCTICRRLDSHVGE